MGDFPPSSSVTLAWHWAAFSAICAPIFGLPVKKTWSNGSSSSRSPITAPSPSIIAISFSGNDSLKSLAMKALTLGVLCDGFAIITFPAAIAEIIGFTSSKNG